MVTIPIFPLFASPDFISSDATMVIFFLTCECLLQSALYKGRISFCNPLQESLPPPWSYVRQRRGAPDRMSKESEKKGDFT